MLPCTPVSHRIHVRSALDLPNPATVNGAIVAVGLRVGFFQQGQPSLVIIPTSGEAQSDGSGLHRFSISFVGIF